MPCVLAFSAPKGRWKGWRRKQGTGVGINDHPPDRSPRYAHARRTSSAVGVLPTLARCLTRSPVNVPCPRPFRSRPPTYRSVAAAAGTTRRRASKKSGRNRSGRWSWKPRFVYNRLRPRRQYGPRNSSARSESCFCPDFFSVHGKRYCCVHDADCVWYHECSATRWISFQHMLLWSLAPANCT